VGIGGSGKAQLLEDARHVLLDPAIGQEDARRDRRVDKTFGHELEQLALAGAQLRDRIVASSATHPLRDNAPIERRAALGHALDGGDEVGQVLRYALSGSFCRCPSAKVCA
jgi:hypothetical protein